MADYCHLGMTKKRNICEVNKIATATRACAGGNIPESCRALSVDKRELLLLSGPGHVVVLAEVVK